MGGREYRGGPLHRPTSCLAPTSDVATNPIPDSVSIGCRETDWRGLLVVGGRGQTDERNIVAVVTAVEVGVHYQEGDVAVLHSVFPR